jgi:hypothetical protein
MELRNLLLDRPALSSKEIFVNAVGRSPAHFRTLTDLALLEKDPLAWRAAWILDSTDEAQPGMASPHIRRIVQRLPQVQSNGVIRSLLRLLCRYEIQEEEQGILIDLCFKYMVSELYPVAVKVHAMQIVYHHVLLYPELKEELVAVIEDQAENNSVGFRARGNRILKQLEKI